MAITHTLEQAVGTQGSWRIRDGRADDLVQGDLPAPWQSGLVARCESRPELPALESVRLGRGWAWALASATVVYTVEGSVRGCCGHRHRTIESAAFCLRRDRLGCRRQGGYSDRQVVVALSGSRTELGQDDAAMVDEIATL